KDGGAGVARPDEVREAIDGVGARHLLGVEARDVEAAGRHELHAPALVERQEIGPRRLRAAQLVDERALLAEERPAETGDEGCQDLALVDTLGRHAEPGTRLQPAARRWQPPVVRVGAELL